MSLSDPLFPQLRTCNNPIVPWFGVQNYRSRYWNEPYFKAIESIRAVADKHGLTMAEIALRWISHHSLLKREYGDVVIIGASRLAHIEEVRRRSALYYSASSVRGAHFMLRLFFVWYRIW